MGLFERIKQKRDFRNRQKSYIVVLNDLLQVREVTSKQIELSTMFDGKNSPKLKTFENNMVLVDSSMNLVASVANEVFNLGIEYFEPESNEKGE